MSSLPRVVNRGKFGLMLAFVSFLTATLLDIIPGSKKTK